MRDIRFIAKRRGGQLELADHQKLALWAADCVEHMVSELQPIVIDQRITEAIKVARAWSAGEVSVGAARAAAREATEAVVVSLARAAGQAVATAHMADHCFGAVRYLLIAVEQSGRDRMEERRWQDDKLPPEISELVLFVWANRKFCLNLRSRE